jgi:mono/diheme cytochrome c family protein
MSGRQYMRAGAIWVTAAAFTLSAAGFAQAKSGAATPPVTTNTPAVSSAEAAQLFAKNCSLCHGPAGEGRIGPQLAGRNLPADNAANRIRSGGKAMPPFGPDRLSNEEVAGLVAYVNAMPAPPAAALLAPPDMKLPGAKVFGADCSMCHGPEGRGLIGPGILNTPVSQQQFMVQVRNGGNGMPPFQASTVSDQDVQAMFTFLHSGVKDPYPGRLFAVPDPEYPLKGALVLAALIALLFVIRFTRRRRFAREDAQATLTPAEVQRLREAAKRDDVEINEL